MGSVPVTSSVGFWLFCSSRAASLNQQCHHGIIPAPWAPAWCSYMEEQLEPPIAAFCTPTEMRVCNRLGERTLLWALLLTPSFAPARGWVSPRRHLKPYGGRAAAN